MVRVRERIRFTDHGISWSLVKSDFEKCKHKSIDNSMEVRS
uniref:Uncharacterized protein n=1 Tax=Rhizophora mucronata TaxID=61149 RepID=A0A2P2QD87_RHIMU